MTIVDPSLTDLSDADARILARQDFVESGGTVTGKELAERYGRSAKWGQNQAAAARAELETRAADGTAVSVRGTAGGAADAPPSVPIPRAADRPPAEKRTPAARGRAPARGTARASALLVGVTAGAVVVVTAVCAVVSYSHIQHLAAAAGMGQLSWWVPLGIDGLVVACSGSWIVDRRNDRPGHPLAMLGIALGLAGTLAANVIAVDPDLVSVRVVRWALAGYPPLALAVAAHLLLRMLDDR